MDATFTENSKTEFGVGPSVQGSANCKLPRGTFWFFHRWTMSANFSGRTSGILSLAEDGTVAVGGFAPVWLSSCSQSQYTISAKLFRDLPKLTC